MTRQYIGARYVTKVYENSLDPSSAEWESGVTFEPLTMVTYNNGSYLSKKEVPGSVGNPASNPDYWVQTGFYNGQITYLQSEIDSINEILSIITPNFENRKFIFIGDSYNTPEHHGGWASRVISQLGLTLGTDCWNSGLGGTGFGTIGLNGGFSGQLQTVISGLSDTEKNAITDVIIAGGANDHQASDSDIQDGFTAVENLVETYLPNAHVTVICCGWSYETATIRDNIIEAYNTYQTCNKYFTIFSRGFITFLDPYYLESDQVHPTANGMDELASVIINAINRGTEYYKHYTDLQAIIRSHVTVSNTGVYGEITENGYHIYKNEMSGLSYADTPIATIDDSNWTKIGYIDSPNNFFEREAVIPITAMYNLGGGTYKPFSAALKIEWDTTNWKVSIKNNFPLDNSNSFSVSSVVGIYFIFDVHLDYVKS